MKTTQIHRSDWYCRFRPLFPFSKEKKQYLIKASIGLIIMLLFASLSAQSDYEANFEKLYAENITKEKINGIYIPSDVEDAMKELDRLSSPEGRKLLVGGKEEDIDKTLIFGLGKWMIVNWNFYEGSRLSHHLKQRGVTMPDDMAVYLITSYYRYLKGLPMELDERAEVIYAKRKKEQAERNKKVN